MTPAKASSDANETCCPLFSSQSSTWSRVSYPPALLSALAQGVSHLAWTHLAPDAQAEDLLRVVRLLKE